LRVITNSLKLYTAMGFFNKDRFPLFIILFIFLICKIPHLSYPFYGDESLFMAPGISSMYSHGLSLLPNAIEPEFGRGHPLLFQAFGALWMHIFGSSTISLHSFCLFIASVLIVFVYEVILRLFNKNVAIICILLLVLNTPFYIESTFLAPDIFIALVTFGILYFYVMRRFFLVFVLLTMYFYTKESAFVLGAVLVIDVIVSIFKNDIPPKVKLRKCVSVFVPVMLGVLFYLVQKRIMGWYSWPGAYSRKATISIAYFSHWYRICLGALIYYEERYLFLLPMLLLALFAAIHQRSYKYLFVFFPAIILFTLRFSSGQNLNAVSCLLLILFFISVGASIYALRDFKYFNRSQQQKFVLLSAIFIFLYFCFFSVYNFQGRYIFSPLVIFCVLVGIFFDFFISKVSKFAFYPLLATFCCIGVYCIANKKNYIDLTLFLKMQTQMNVVSYFEENNLFGKAIYSNSNWFVTNMQTPSHGYLHSGKVFSNMSSVGYDSSTDYLIYSNALRPFSSLIFDSTAYLKVKSDSSLQLIYKKENGPVWAEVYKRK